MPFHNDEKQNGIIIITYLCSFYVKNIFLSQGSNLVFPTSAHHTRPMMHMNHLPHNAHTLYPQGLQPPPSASIRGTSHLLKGRSYLM